MSPILEARELRHTEEGLRILSRVHFSLDPGRVLAVVGPNGSGKSTLLQILCGLRGDSSAIQICGRSMSVLSQRERALRITYVGEDYSSEFPLTAQESVLLGGLAPGRELATEEHLSQVYACMRETGCFEFRDRMLGVLSSGERQRVALARAFYQSSDVLCLDESFSRLDPQHQVRMGELLRTYAGRGKTIVFVSHDLNFASAWADDWLLLYRGEQVDFGSKDRVLSAENLGILYPDALIDLENTGRSRRIYFRSSLE